MTITVLIGLARIPARLPDWLPFRGWQIHKELTRKRGTGYLKYVSRSKHTGIKRGRLAHREVIERLLGRPLAPHEHIHHMDFNKLNCCPCNLLLTTAEFNPSPVRRDPYTGDYLSTAEYQRRYGDTGYRCVA